MSTFETPEPISLTVELGVGDLRIVAADRTDTVVDVRPSDPSRRADVIAAEQTRVELTAGGLQIKAPKGWRQWTFRGGRESVDVRIELPAGSRLRGGAGVAALRAEGRLGECRFQTGVGDIHIEHAGPVDLKTGVGDVVVDRVDGRAEVTTGSGAVEIGMIDGPAGVKNSNGDVRIGTVTGLARASAANGAISVDRAHDSITAKTAFGDVHVGDVVRGVVEAHSGFGAIEIGVRDGVAAWLDLSTHFGTVRNDLDESARPGQGEDAVQVQAQTSYGDIDIRRSFADHATEARS
jgi:hypothetical protein